MLRKLSISKKLALLLVAPVLALFVLTVLGVWGSLADSSDTSDAEQRVSMSARTGDLFEAARQEAARNQLAVLGTNLDMDDVRDATDTATAAWLSEVSPYQADDVRGLIDYLQDFGAHRTQITAQYGTDVDGAAVVSELDLDLLERIAAFDARVAGSAEPIVAGELATASQLTDAALSSTVAELLGFQTAATGEVTSPDLAGAISSANADLDAYTARTGATVASGDLAAMNDSLSEAGVGDPVSVDQQAWLDASEARAISISSARSTLIAATADTAALEASDTSSKMRNTALIGLAGIILGGLAMMVIGGMMRKIMGELTVEAAAVAQHDVPALAEALSRGETIGSETEERPFLDVEGTDEFADLGQSLNEIRRSTQAVAEEQGQLVQSGIAEMFVSLARRNQTLVDRQLEVIDELEAQEVDADRLSQVYRVDHLATRMRRNAESLLVLAGNNSPRKRGPAVDVREVVRVAIGEVEDYRRIIPISLDETPVAGHAAQDLAHLLSELMENATQSSPPGTVADVVGTIEPDGSYSVSVIDRGTGIDATKRGELNVLLAKPPKNTLSGSMTMGLTVVARLAQRVGVTVQLVENEPSGTVASVVLPAELVAEWGGGRPEAEPEVPAFGAVSSGVPGSSSPTTASPEPAVDEGDKPLFEPFDFGADEPEKSAPAAAAAVGVVGAAEAVGVPDVPDIPAPTADLPPIPDVPPSPDVTGEPAPLAPPPLDSLSDFADAPEFGTDVPTLDSDVFEPMDVMEPFELPSLDPAALQSEDDVVESSLDEMPAPDAASPFDELSPPELTDAPIEPIEPIDEASVPASGVFDDVAPPASGAFNDVPAPAPAFDEAPTPDAPVHDQARVFDQTPVFDEAPTPAAVFDEIATPSTDRLPEEFGQPPAPPVPETAAPEPVAVGADDGATTGRLTRRRRSTTPPAETAPSLDADRTAPSKRSPDQVKSMLSRYKTGLEKGRSTEQDSGS